MRQDRISKAERDHTNFNPRTPCGVRRTVQLDHTKLSSISIHAPRAGCDIQRKANHARTSDFNPRTPCGVRLEKLRINFNAVLFQSTHPVRGATQSLFRYKGDLTIFQSTHPVRGATSARGLPMLLVLNFNPRTPCGVRRPKFNYEVRHKNISIHAPRAGCDDMEPALFPDSFNFNPRTPCGVRPDNQSKR